jgi:hypothetical protein
MIMKRKLLCFLLLNLVSLSLHAKLAQFVHEVEMNQKIYTNWKAYFPLVEKYLPDIKDSLYNSCAPALQQIRLLSVQDGMDLIIATFRTVKMVDEYARETKNTALINEMYEFDKKYYNPAAAVTQRYPKDEHDQYINVTSKVSGIVSPGGSQRWIVQNLENKFCKLMSNK